MIIILGMLTSINSLTIYNVSINSTNSNTSLTFDEAINTSSISFGDDYVSLENFTFNNSKLFYINTSSLVNNISLFNFTVSNTEVNSSNFIDYFRFNNTGTGDLVSNYSYGNFTSENETLPIFFTALGNEDQKDWTFSKSGYVSSIYSFNFSYDSFNDIIFNISTTTITVNIYDRSTLVLLNQTVDINLVGLANQTTSNGTTVFQDISFSSGDYLIQAISSGYYTAQKTFTYNNEQDIIVDIYMLNESAAGTTTLVVPIIDEFFNVIQDADTRLLQYDPTIFGFIEVAQCFSNSNGECKFLIEEGIKTYIVTTSKTIDNILFTAQSSENGEIFLQDISDGTPITGEIYLRQLVLKLSSNLNTPSSIGLNMIVPDNESDTIVSENTTSTVINIPVQFSTDTGLSYTVCLEIYRTNGLSFNQEFLDCATGSSGIIPTVNIILNNDFNYEARVTIEFDGNKEIYKTYKYKSNESFIALLVDQNLVSPVIILFWVILLSTCLYLRSIGIWVKGAWILSVIQIGIFQNYLVASSSVIIILINIGVLYISKKQGDTV